MKLDCYKLDIFYQDTKGRSLQSPTNNRSFSTFPIRMSHPPYSITCQMLQSLQPACLSVLFVSASTPHSLISPPPSNPFPFSCPWSGLSFSLPPVMSSPICLSLIILYLLSLSSINRFPFPFVAVLGLRAPKANRSALAQINDILNEEAKSWDSLITLWSIFQIFEFREHDEIVCIWQLVYDVGCLSYTIFS